MKKYFAIALALAAAGSAQAAVPSAKIQAMLARPAVMCGRFDQTKQLAGMKKPLASEGRFCVIAGKGVLWRTLKPFPSMLRLTREEIVNYQGERVAMRLDAKTEPTVRMINNVLFSLLAGDLGQLDALFEGEGSVDGNNWSVALKPRQAALEKAIGTIKLEGGSYVKSIVMNEAGGDRTTIVFSAIQNGEGAMSKEEAALF
jgi:outer membrane lipoprotein-sorting protein